MYCYVIHRTWAVSWSSFLYTYDGAGNRATSDFDGFSTATSFAYNYTSGTDQLSSVNINRTYTSDAMGNIVEIDEGASTVVQLSYHLSNQLLAVNFNGLDVLFNFYDHQGQRIFTAQSNFVNPKLYNYDLAGRMISEAHLTDSSPTTPVDAVLDYVYLGNHRVAVLTGTINPGPGVGCFVATAAYGTSMSVDIEALRALRDRALKSFSVGRSFIDWYYLRGPHYAHWLMDHPGWKPIVRAGLIVPVGLSKIAFYRPLAGLLLMGTCVLCAFWIGKKRRWNKARISMGAFLLTFTVIIIYSMIVKVPEARATRPDTELVAGRAYFLYEDHIGRPVRMTEYADYDNDGSYEYGNGSTSPYWKASYKPFGQVYSYFNSTGITVGTSPNDISWIPPFRFPGQYEDPELDGYIEIFYNQHRFYVPGIGRYSSADPLESQPRIKRAFESNANGRNPFEYAGNNPIIFADRNGLCKECDDCPSGLWHAEGFGGGGFFVIVGVTSYHLNVKCSLGKAEFNITYTCFNFGGGLGGGGGTVLAGFIGCSKGEAENNLLGWGWFANVYPEPIPTGPGFGTGIFASSSSCAAGVSLGYGLEGSAGGSYCWRSY